MLPCASILPVSQPNDCQDTATMDIDTAHATYQKLYASIASIVYG
jgi:hypothetical protein